MGKKRKIEAMSYKFHIVECILTLAVLLMPSVTYAQNTDYFPTFNMMSMLEISEKCPLKAESGETLRLVDYYGSDVQLLMEKLGPPEYVSSMLYFDIYPYWGFGEISRIMDLYHEIEVPVKIYEWPKSSVYVYCVRNGEQFEYPFELTRYWSSFHSRRSGKLPLEEWLAAESGDNGWYVLAWSKEREECLDDLARCEYAIQKDSNKTPINFFNPKFMSRFTFDSFTNFYFRTMKLSSFVPEIYRDKCLAEFAGMTYREFVKIAGKPSVELVTIDGNVPFETLHIIWPLKKLLSGHDTCQIKICAYEYWDDYQLFVYFIKGCGSWRLVYADIAPLDYVLVQF